MTGISSSRGRLFRNFDSYKNQEWLRRRKLRIEQVRQQSSEIAKALRQKVENEEKLRNLELAKVEELKFKNWRAEKLDEMEKKLRFALEEFGLGHRLIENEPDPKEILETKNELNKWKAQERGDIAALAELKKKKLEINKKMSSIERKKSTRKLEDLRSALVCSLKVHKQFLKLGEYPEFFEPVKDLENIERKTTIKKKRIQPFKNQNFSPVKVKEVIVKKKSFENPLLENSSQVFQEKLNRQSTDQTSKSSQNKDKIWIELNDQNISATDSNNKSLENKTVLSTVNSNSEKTEKSVEFYDYNSRYQCKTFREYPNVVEKIETFNMPQSSDICKEVANNQISEKKKEEADFLCKERGNKALKKEKINREYNDLIAKLNDLHKKEKIIKAMQHIPSDFVFMNDDRILEKIRNRQRVMNSKFESLYHEAIFNKNTTEAEVSRNISCDIDDADSNERVSTKVSFSPKNFKVNSPTTTTCFSKENSPHVAVTGLKTKSKVNSPSTSASSPQENFVSPKVTKLKKKRKKVKQKLVAHIDKTLKEGRELRESVGSRLQYKSPPTSHVDESENERVKIKTKLVSPIREELKKRKKTFKNQTSQTEDIKEKTCSCSDIKEKVEVLENHTENDSLLLSSATSYKSPPCEIQSSKLVEFLQLSDLLSKVEGHENCLNLKRKIEDTLLNLLHEMQLNQFEYKDFSLKHMRNPTLKDYILKLLNMSREKIANLSISFESTPTPNFEDRNNENYCESVKSESESSCSCQNQIESQKTNYEVELEKFNKPMQSWKSVSKDTSKSEKDENISEQDIGEYKLEIIGDYNKITRKCEKRIEELSNLLNKVRQEKEKLLILPTEPSNQTDIYYPPNVKGSFDSILGEEENVSKGESIDSLSITDSSDAQSTIDTFPDVLEELLEKKILTSPFKWYKEEHVHKQRNFDFKSIEGITHNFRNQMSKIKPRIFDSGDLPTICSSTEEM